jgi:glycosyltransferase involved in cell wall biosynthesis
LAACLGEGNYCYASTLLGAADRDRMGWDCNDRESWILRVGESQAARQKYEAWWTEADVVLCGDVGAPDKGVGLMAKRLTQGNLTFYASERWWKPPLGRARLLHPRFVRMAISFRRLAQNRHFHYLPVGYLAADDMRKWVSFQGRSWLWGYFTDDSDLVPKPNSQERDFRVLYAGRLLRWKRVDTLVRAFGLLRRHQPMAQLDLIGDGPEGATLKALAGSLGLMDAISFHSSVPMKQVWHLMRAAHVYVLPSNGYEGWGAVVNEAMTQGCAIVASEEGGAARTMIAHGENGLVFRSGDWNQLGQLLMRLSDDDNVRLRLARAGQHTVREWWSPAVAARRFLAVSEGLLSGQSVPRYPLGPMCRLYSQ